MSRITINKINVPELNFPALFCDLDGVRFLLPSDEYIEDERFVAWKPTESTLMITLKSAIPAEFTYGKRCNLEQIVPFSEGPLGDELYKLLSNDSVSENIVNRLNVLRRLSPEYQGIPISRVRIYK